MEFRWESLLILFATLFAVGCLNGVEAACNTRCEEEQQRGCRDTSVDCASICFDAGQISNELFTVASKANCGSSYLSWENCLIDAPACTDIEARCAAELAVLDLCVDGFCRDNPGACD